MNLGRIRLFALTVVNASEIDRRVRFVVARPELPEHVLRPPTLELPPCVSALLSQVERVRFRSRYQPAAVRLPAGKKWKNDKAVHIYAFERFDGRFASI